MPIATTYKGIRIHVQPAKRIALVKREIDKVSNIADLVQLSEIAGDAAWSPEARLLAGAKCCAGLQRATERRNARPDIDPEYVTACTAGLNSRKWADPFRYCSLFDAHHERAAVRDEPLPDLE